jgi:DNA-binding SARP family transcriptional activator
LIAARDESNPNRIDAWQRVIDLYRGPFLQGHSDEWILDRRRDFRIGYLDAMMHMAQVWFERERYDQALSLLNKALAEDSSREDIHRELMRLYANVGRRSEAASHFQQLADHLKSKGLSPAEETQALYAEIMA